MSKKEESDPAFIRALEKRVRLDRVIRDAQETIRKATIEVKELDGWMRMHQRLLADDEPGEETSETEPAVAVTAKTVSISGYAGHGSAQEVFERAAQEIIAERGYPMQSPEIVDELDKRGMPLGANPVKAGWNRLWQAKKNGVLVNIPRHGYWPAAMPVPEHLPPPKRTQRRVAIQRNTGRPRGRQRTLNNEQIAWAREQLIREDKTIKEICAEVGGIAPGTLLSYFGMSRTELREQAGAANNAETSAKPVESGENSQN